MNGTDPNIKVEVQLVTRCAECGNYVESKQEDNCGEFVVRVNQCEICIKKKIDSGVQKIIRRVSKEL